MALHCMGLIKIIGFDDFSYVGLVEGGEKIKKMNWDDVRGFLHMVSRVLLE